MPRLLETISRRVHWGYVITDQTSESNSNGGTYEPDWENMDEKVGNLIQELSEDQWEIKSIIPLISSRYYTEALLNKNGLGSPSTWGAGYGYGAPFTEGVLVLAQRWIELSEDEIRRKRETARAEAEARRKAEYERIMRMPVEKTGGFVKPKWSFAGTEYNTESEAVLAREARAKAALQS